MSAEAPERSDRLEVVDGRPAGDPYAHDERSEEKPSGLRGLLTRLRTPRPAGTRSTRTVVVLAVVTIVSLLSLWLLLYAFVLSGLQESRSQTVLYAQLREGLSGATTPFGGAITPGTPLMTMDAPELGLHHAVVVEGTSSAQLTLGPGHLASTVLPGQDGTSVVFGRSVTFGAPFADLVLAKPGDSIVVTTGQGTFHYTVSQLRRPGDPLPAPPTAGTSRLTLVTSSGTGWRAGWAPQQTVYVDAAMSSSDKVQPTPSGRAAAVADSARAMKGDASALLPLVFLLQLLFVVAVAAVWARVRWGLWQTWVIAVPLVLACLWGVTAAATQLTPNLI
jgi:sortase A